MIKDHLGFIAIGAHEAQQMARLGFPQTMLLIL